MMSRATAQQLWSSTRDPYIGRQSCTASSLGLTAFCTHLQIGHHFVLSQMHCSLLRITCCYSSADARRRAAAFGRALAGHVTKLRSEPSAYGGTGLSELLGMREECLREFGFKDVYRSVSILFCLLFPGESDIGSVVNCLQEFGFKDVYGSVGILFY